MFSVLLLAGCASNHRLSIARQSGIRLILPSSTLQMLTVFISSISEIRSAASPGEHSPSSELHATTREDAWL